MIKYKIDNGSWIEVKLKQFKDGSMNVDIQQTTTEIRERYITVAIQFGDKELTGYSMNDMIVALGLTMDALKRHFTRGYYNLMMPYAPYARQDRPCSPGEAFSARFAAQMINAMGFDTVCILDAHSGVLSGVYNNLYETEQYKVFKEIYNDWSDVYIVAPDMGAVKKANKLFSEVGAAGVLVCDKKRDMKSIEITGYEIVSKVNHNMEKFLVLDDICDGGRTFLKAHEAICDAVREAKGFAQRIDLAVTHGLFTFGVDVVANEFNNVYTTNSYKSNKDASNVKVIEVF
ncbi:ribose-phosphate pyrophosphokinase [Pseudomonas phage phiPMW]|uniref:Ribose-phosphate pyrophosphokinase n=1 Tax=Pseudomonas phage phiPMW TaxID=1815582 RepID=A0A1S5R1D9_9CAUD|nr:ribose-phosphate pyrophosphokinase [Pseudomonas phage phiPMW]ANA49232.1 ribose-phosphate pyrophosphokinase [Pseudomonas phage phiPMW]